MGHGIVKLADNEFIEWSTVVDAPITNIMTKEEAVNHYMKEIAQHGGTQSEETPRSIAVASVDRADKLGTSFKDMDGESIQHTGPEYIKFNRAGPNEQSLTLEEIREKYGNDDSS